MKSPSTFDVYETLHKYFDQDWLKTDHFDDSIILQKIDEHSSADIWSRRAYVGVPPGIAGAWNPLTSRTLTLLKSWSAADLCAVGDRADVFEEVIKKTQGEGFEPDEHQVYGMLLSHLHFGGPKCLQIMPDEWVKKALKAPIPDKNWWEDTFGTTAFMSSPPLRNWLSQQESSYHTIGFEPSRHRGHSMAPALHAWWVQFKYPEQDGNFLVDFLSSYGTDIPVFSGGSGGSFKFDTRRQQTCRQLGMLLDLLPPEKAYLHLTRALSSVVSGDLMHKKEARQWFWNIMFEFLEQGVGSKDTVPEARIRVGTRGTKLCDSWLATLDFTLQKWLDSSGTSKGAEFDFVQSLSSLTQWYVLDAQIKKHASKNALPIESNMVVNNATPPPLRL